MASVNVLNWKKEKVSTIDLAPEVFAVEVKQAVLHEVVKWQLASRRQGTAMTKTRGLVSGGGVKPFKQKGTGNARQGSSRSPLMPGGAKLFGPVPRSYEYSLPKKIRKLALKMALSHLAKEGRLYVVDSMESKGKTGELAKQLKTFGLKKAVLVNGAPTENLKRASKNLPTYKLADINGLNVYDLLKYDHAILSKDAVAKIVERMQAE
ncbi:MAG: 50S ribosomal protein L4 [Pseudobdellovibrionaceae bacterium]|jgi:large subunit ribosomal protein L4|nr:50S ribosomal protein L4 [Pseudomonadota bacterium]